MRIFLLSQFYRSDVVGDGRSVTRADGSTLFQAVETVHRMGTS